MSWYDQIRNHKLGAMENFEISFEDIECKKWSTF